MSAYYRSSSPGGDAGYPDYSGSLNRSQGYLKTQDYPDFSGPQTNPGYPSKRSNPFSAGSRTNPDHPRSLAEPDYPGSPSKPDYPGARNNPYSAGSRTNPDHHRSLPEPDYIESQSNPYHPGLSREPDYPGSQQHPDFASPGSSRISAVSRINPGYLGSLAGPDYPGAQDNSNHPGPRANASHPGSRRNLEYASSSINSYTDTLGEPDYPGAENQTSSAHIWGEPDYPNAEDYRNAPKFWGEPDYPGAKNGPGYGSSETQEMIRSNGPLGILRRESEDYPGSIEMTSMEVADPHEQSLPGAPVDGYVNPAYVGERGPVCAYGNLPLSECDWHKSPEGQKLIASLIPMTSRDRIKTIRNQPRTMEEKRKLRKAVDRERSKQCPRTLELRCCAQCLNSCSRGCRRSRNGVSELLNTTSLWQKTLKVIGGKFGTSVLSYFNFLKWLLKFNIFSFIVNFSFLVIPQLTVAEKNTLPFTGLEFFTGAGYFRDTVMYYGFYTNSSIRHGGTGISYNMQLAYLFTIGACLIICFFSLLFSMAKYFRNNFINPHIYSRGIAKLIFCWDFTVTHEKAVKLKQKNLSTEIRENLSEIRLENTKLTFHQQLTRLSAHVAAWLVSTGMAIACCVAVYYLAEYNSECWETLIGQEIYRLLLMDFVFSLADSFLGEFLRRIGMFFCPLLPFIQMITLFIMFYVKNVSLMVNFQPPSKAWRASQMMTFFIFLLFFPSFTGVLCTLAITIWRLKPSADCGPFRGLPAFIHSVYGWIDTLSGRPGYRWVVWIYHNLIGSVHFFFILTLIVL
ncbi:Transmembrane channel-like protein 5 [Sciurus carolinensis]|uniref:Transmembrane channel-like protein n=1 Tax=Sciurus carolinensis TaxID=30640 RepID=A0AA41N2Z1_SCICA|nr:Transmembrane channel-like protein 5 [Sciurus carolinensis]